jgi:hypothetical protein
MTWSRGERGACSAFTGAFEMVQFLTVRNPQGQGKYEI